MYALPGDYETELVSGRLGIYQLKGSEVAIDAIGEEERQAALGNW